MHVGLYLFKKCVQCNVYWTKLVTLYSANRTSMAIEKYSPTIAQKVRPDLSTSRPYVVSKPLCPWLVSSSEVADTVDDIISPCGPVCCVVLFQPRLCHISLTCICPP